MPSLYPGRHNPQLLGAEGLVADFEVGRFGGARDTHAAEALGVEALCRLVQVPLGRIATGAGALDRVKGRG